MYLKHRYNDDRITADTVAEIRENLASAKSERDAMAKRALRINAHHEALRNVVTLLERDLQACEKVIASFVPNWTDDELGIDS